MINRLVISHQRSWSPSQGLLYMLAFTNLFQFLIAVHWTHPSCVFTFFYVLTPFYHLLTSTGHIDAHYDASLSQIHSHCHGKLNCGAVPLSLSNHESLYGVASRFCFFSSFLICVVSYLSGHDADYLICLLLWVCANYYCLTLFLLSVLRKSHIAALWEMMKQFISRHKLAPPLLRQSKTLHAR